MYIATSYIGGDYTPGEIIRENLPRETIERLLKAGAIRKTAPDPEAPVMADAPEAEIDEEAEAPEIDVMDGLVAAQEEPEQKKTVPMATRKPGSKAAKGGKTK